MPEHGLLNALVLAGSRYGELDPVARAAGVSCKAFAEAGGRPMVERVVETLAHHPRIDRLEVALADGADLSRGAPGLKRLAESGRVRLVSPARSPAQTVAAALARREVGRELLITTADHALLSAAMVDRFLAAGDAAGADALAAVLPLELFESRYPGVRRTGLAFRDGRYSGCNLFRLQPGPGAEAVVSFWRRLESLRKRPWRMALVVGPRALLAYALRRLTLSQAFEVVGARAGCQVAPVVMDVPEAAIDVDTPEDLVLVNRLLGARPPA